MPVPYPAFKQLLLLFLSSAIPVQQLSNDLGQVTLGQLVNNFPVTSLVLILLQTGVAWQLASVGQDSGHLRESSTIDALIMPLDTYRLWKYLEPRVKLYKGYVFDK
jgi:hypothetical protein